MRKVGFFYDELFQKHDAGRFHPESPQRLEAILQGIKNAGLSEKLVHVKPEPATKEQLLLAHTAEHFEAIHKYALSKSTQIDADTHVSEHSFDAAMLAAGAAVGAVNRILDGELDAAFAAVRPPGHHATSDQAMGFCLFNNIAIAARWLTRNRGLKTVMIMDWDVHHGNGTQDIFYDDPSVIYISLHKKHHYPGSGWPDEMGAGAARGTKINRPINTDDPLRYEDVFDETLALADRYKPEFILISCGFDAHERDPLGNLGLTNETYARLTLKLSRFAERFGHRRLFSILEGGYDMRALAEASAAHVSALME
jgi:acetoin utilization deacetylase AcuC-like enzyme